MENHRSLQIQDRSVRLACVSRLAGRLLCPFSMAISRVELRWLPLVGFAHGILIDPLVLPGALVLIPMNFRVLQASSNPL